MSEPSALRRKTRALVYQGHEVAGSIERTARGSTFRYLPAFLSSAKQGIAQNLPLGPAVIETVGVNLHTFFAGLLPEGLRLSAITRSAKTSADDLLTLLMAAGSDTIGDVSVVAEGEVPQDSTPTADVLHPEQASFADLFDLSIRYGRGRPEIAVPGVQQKISAGMISFPVVSKTGRAHYILKLSPPDLPHLVENEAFFMDLASRSGMACAKTKLIRDRENNAGLLVQRFDRVPRSDGAAPTRLHQEDACQLLDRYPADKYNVTCSDVAGALAVCTAPLVELNKLMRLVAFSYLIGNGDLHGKNISVRTLASGLVELSPAYDLLSTVPYGDRTMALPMDGRDDNLKRTTFIQFGERMGVRRAATSLMLDDVCGRVAPAVDHFGQLGLDARKTKHLANLVRKRLADLSP